MLNQGNYDNALQVVKKLTRDQPNDWELSYREGVALGETGDKAADAKSVFEAILAFRKFVQTTSSVFQKRIRPKKGSGPSRSAADRDTHTNPTMQRSQNIQKIRQAVGLEDSRNNFGSPPSWYSKDYGRAFAWDAWRGWRC